MRYAGCRCSRAHPHSCGETGTLAVQDLCATRGKPGRVHGVTESLGLIPAHAGKTPPRDDGRNLEGLIPAHAGKTGTGTGSVVTRGAHPHSCGENLIGVTADLSAQGSSPLMRGKRVARRFAGHLTGLIPAHAGKPSSGSRRASGGRAHPRSCGENAFCSATKGLR